MTTGVPVAICAVSNGISSGSASPTTSTVLAPAGTMVLVALNTGTLNEAVSSLVDSQGNNYTLVQPSTSAGSTNNCFGWIIVPTSLPIGTSWTAVIGGASSWNLKSVWYTPGVVGVDKAITSVVSVAGTSASVSSGTLTYRYEVGFAYIYFTGNGAGGGTVTESPGFTNLVFNTPSAFNDIAYIDQSASTTQFTYAPTWTTSSTYTVILLTFQVLSKLTPANAFPGIPFPQHGTGLSKNVENFIYPGAVQPPASPPSSGLSVSNAFPGIPFSNHTAGKAHPQTRLLPGAAQPATPFLTVVGAPTISLVVHDP